MGIKALILAAGFGSRLRPLTLHVPKPLLPFFGPTLLDFAIFRLRLAGIEHIAINVHHLGEQIKDHICSSGYQSITMSSESIMLGTAGAINPLRSWLGQDDLLICNSDVISDINLKTLIEAHRSRGALATMGLLETLVPGTNPVNTEGSQVRSIGIAGTPKVGSTIPLITPHTFACSHILSPGFLNEIPARGPSEIVPIYQRLLMEGASVEAIKHQGFWCDLGTPADYWQAYEDVFANLPLLDHKLGISTLCEQLGLRGHAVLEKSKVFVAAGARVAPGAALDHAVVLSGANVAQAEALSYVVITPHSIVKVHD